MARKKVLNMIHKNSKITNSKQVAERKISQNQKILLTFENFKLYPIKINKIFNNHFRDQDDYVEKISLLLNSFRLFSNYKLNDLIGNNSLQNQLHFHPIEKNLETVQNVLKEYRFNDAMIDDIIGGNNLFQISLEAKRSSIRMVIQRTDNLFSALFMDTNHHIYLNDKMTKDENTMFLDYCPMYNNDDCNYMTKIGDCLAVDFLDHEKIKKSYDYDYASAD